MLSSRSLYSEFVGIENWKAGAEGVLGCARESATARKWGRVAFAAEVEEKSGAALSKSNTGFATLSCAFDSLTMSSSKNADTPNPFLIRLSEGCPPTSVSHAATVNNTGAFVRALSVAKAKTKKGEAAWRKPYRGERVFSSRHPHVGPDLGSGILLSPQGCAGIFKKRLHSVAGCARERVREGT